MIRIAMRLTLVALVLAACVAVGTAQARAEGCSCSCTPANCPECGPQFPGCKPYGENYRGDLFYNFYSQGYCDRPAGIYPSPLPTPLMAGRTYVTYQPLMPHEFMYKHHRSYHTYYDGGKGLNRTQIKYNYNPVAAAFKSLHYSISFAR